jgi:subtilase family protein/Big-like domain-containing protein
VTRIVLALAAAAALFPAAASAAEPLSYRLQIVASPAGARGSADEQARRLGLAAEGPGSLLRLGGDYVAQVRVRGDVQRRAAALRAAGARIVHVSDDYDTVSVAVARGELEAVAGVTGVEAVTEELEPMVGKVGAHRLNTCQGAKTSEGDAQLGAATARSDFELDGAGVEVGVLSDSFDTSAGAATHASGDVTSGDLPGPGNPCNRTAPVSVLEDFLGGADEGRGMTQIVHDLAPGADLSFATAFTGELAFAQNIVDLKDAGADVIADDVIYFQEPMFQDGPLANAVSQVTDAGVAYFSMAFNDNQIDASNRDIASWEAPAYRATPCPALVTADPDFVAGSDCMDFDPGAGADPAFGIGVVSGRVLRIDLQWAEPRSGVASDFDLYLLNSAGNQISAESHNVNATTQMPFEFAALTAGSTGTREVVVVRKAGTTGTPRMKFVVGNNGVEITSFEYPADSGGDVIGPSIFGHNGTAKAQTVGAMRFDVLNAPERYSSRGPVTLYFGPVSGSSPAAPLAQPLVLSKPDVTATDGGANTFFGSNAGGGTFRFFGTSAAAPHAAAVAALQLQGNPGLTPTQVKDAQKTTADAIGAFGPFAVGAGLVDARAAIAQTLLPPVVTATGPPANTSNPQPTTTFSANRPADFTCAIDGGTAAACTSPFTPPAPLADGDHTVTVVATDRAGRTGTSGPKAFHVDTTGPVVTIQTGPSGVTDLAQPTFSFTANEAVSAYECRFDAAGFAPCSGPASHTPAAPLGDGAHTFEVRATDILNNTGSAASRSFTVDTGGGGGNPTPTPTPTPTVTPTVTVTPTATPDVSGPTLTFTKKPAKETKKRRAKFAMSASEPATLACKVDSNAFKPCGATKSFTVKPGRHTFKVRGTDAAGNVGPTLSYRWKVLKPKKKKR